MAGRPQGRTQGAASGTHYTVPVMPHFTIRPKVKVAVQPQRRVPQRRCPTRVSRKLVMAAAAVLGCCVVYSVLCFVPFTSTSPVYNSATSQTANTGPQSAEAGGEPFEDVPLLSLQQQGTMFLRSPYNIDNRPKGDAAAAQQEDRDEHSYGLFGILNSQRGGRGGGGNAGTHTNKLIVWQASDVLQINSSGSDVFRDCPQKMCTVSTNPDDLTKADAVVFGNWWITRHDPPARQPHQLFIYYNMNPSNYVRLRYFFPTWRSAFNWTWSYRRDSDIFQPAAFLQKVKPPHTYRQYKVMVKEKSQLAFLVKKQSRSQSKVEEYVERLSQEITVTQIPETEIKAMTTHVKGSADLKDLANQHFFYLSFEKALCADFVTDAFFDLYDPEVNAVPVVRGRADYRTLFPQDTFVDSSIAAGPKELAASLKELSMNLKLYSAMLWRKSQYVKRDGLPLAWCQLCEKLHSYHGDRYYEDIQSWWWKNGQCHTSRRI